MSGLYLSRMSTSRESPNSQAKCNGVLPSYERIHKIRMLGILNQLHKTYRVNRIDIDAFLEQQLGNRVTSIDDSDVQRRCPFRVIDMDDVVTVVFLEDASDVI
jgi:hypothetical protein